MLIKRFVGMITLFFFTFLIFSCTSVPEVKRVNYMGGGKYDVVVDRDYLENPEELKYAINSFVKKQGGTSYNVEQYGPNDFYVTIPGKTPVEDLPEIKHFHKGKTTTAIVVPSVGALLILLIAMFNPNTI